MPSDDHKFERALAQHLRGGSAGANCPDAEILAAYHERNLSLEEMAGWKEHISACESCQQVLALVEATENQLAEVWEERGVPVMEAASMVRARAERSSEESAKAGALTGTPAPASPLAILRRRPALLRWAIPLGAVAAGVLVFIGIYEQREAKVAHYSDTIIAKHQEPAVPTPMLDAEKRKEQLERESKDEGAFAEEISRQKTDQGLAVKASPKPAEQTRSGERATPESRNLTAGRVVAKKAEAPPPPPSPEIGTQANRDAGASGNAPVAAGAPRPAPPTTSMAYGGNVGGTAGEMKARVDAKSAPAAATETVTAETAAPQADTTTSAVMIKQGVARQRLQVTGSGAGLILTPDNKVFWKLLPAGMVQLTTDGGKNWKAVETEANAELTAGFAPSSRICWIAGKAGVLVLTTDRGRHWTRISTPIAVSAGESA